MASNPTPYARSRTGNGIRAAQTRQSPQHDRATWPADAAGRALLRAECHGLIAQDGIAYQTLNQLAYRCSWPAFPHRHTGQLNWTFFDASTGHMIEAVLAREPGAAQLL